MLIGWIRGSTDIMGFDKVKINTTSLLLLLLEGGSWYGFVLRLHYTHKHAHTPSNRYRTNHHSHPDIYVVHSPPHPFLSLPPPPAPLPPSRCLCPRHKHSSIPPPSRFSLLLQRLCLLQWTFMTTHSVRVLYSLPLFLLHSPQVKY